jgi:hypothetical protein
LTVISKSQDDSPLWSELQELFVLDSSQPKDKDSLLSAVIIKIVLQIVPSIATIFCSRLLDPFRFRSAIEIRSISRGIWPSFQACVRGISASLGFSVTRLIIDEFFKFLISKVEKLSPLLLGLFATVVQLFRDIPLSAKKFASKRSFRKRLKR